jgi:hypothetical protein
MSVSVVRKTVCVASLFVVMSVAADAVGQISVARFPDMTTSRLRSAACYHDGYIYVCGGQKGSNLASVMRKVERFDLNRQVWESVQNLPIPLAGAVAVSVSDRIYVIGGYTYPEADQLSASVFELNPSTGAWTDRRDMPTARKECAVAVLGGRIIVAGGRTSEGVTNIVEEYDPTTDLWSQLTPMTVARAKAKAVVLGGIVFLVGGELGGNALSLVEGFNRMDGTWTGFISMPEGRYGHGLVATGNSLYVIGGRVRPWYEVQPEIDVLQLPPERDSWRPFGTVGTSMSGYATVAIGNEVYLIGGSPPGLLSGTKSTITRIRLSSPVSTGGQIKAGNRAIQNALVYGSSVRGITVPTHPNPDLAYCRQIVEASWTPELVCNGYLWQINEDPDHTLQLPPVGDDWWTMTPELNWVVPAGGDWYLHVGVVDIDGQPGETQHRRIRVLDSEPEISSTTHGDPTLVYPFPHVSLVWNQDGVDTVYAVIDDNPRTVPDRTNSEPHTSSPIRYLNQPNGTHFVHIRGTDPAGQFGPVAHMQVNIGAGATPAPPGAPRVVTTREDGPQSSSQQEGDIHNRAASGKPLAVIDFAPQGVDSNAATLLSSRLRDALVRTGLANVYERTRVDLILEEMGFHKSGCVEAACAVEIGQLVGVEQMVVGEVGRLGAAYLVSARLIDVESGRVIRTASSPGTSSPDALLRYLPSMAWTLMSAR